MKIIGAVEKMRCPECGKTLVYANQQGEVAGRFICRNKEKCSRAKSKEPIEI
jgi:hypothetical protein